MSQYPWNNGHVKVMCKIQFCHLIIKRVKKSIPTGFYIKVDFQKAYNALFANTDGLSGRIVRFKLTLKSQRNDPSHGNRAPKSFWYFSQSLHVFIFHRVNETRWHLNIKIYNFLKYRLNVDKKLFSPSFNYKFSFKVSFTIKR